MFKVKDISKKFGRVKVLDEVRFGVEQGEFLTLIGPSGCGKSTLLRIIAGVDKDFSGDLIWNGEHTLGFVFQNFALLPYLTVFENIEFGLKMKGVKEKERTRVVLELVKEMGLEGFEDKHPMELSGGMKQRVGIGRALAVNPDLLLLDEPFSSLDELTAESLRKLLLEIWQRRKMTVVMVTHLISEAVELADRIIVFSKSPGTVKEVVENDLGRPRDLRAAEVFLMEDKLKEDLETNVS